MPDSFVLDCSVAAKWVFPERGSAAALQLFDRYAAREIVLIVPNLLMAEFASLVANESGESNWPLSKLWRRSI